MKSLRLFAFGALCLPLILASQANAQASRTWVSGIGDDNNNCSRTAPCQTFAGAYSKTGAGGEINVLDSGGFGTLTILKSITISADGVTAGVLASSVNGITVSTPANSVVVLRGLDIGGAGSGVNGIQFIGSGQLHVENCTIRGFGFGNGINFVPTSGSELFVINTVITETGNGGTAAAGIKIFPGSGASVTAVVNNVKSDNNNGSGILVDGSNAFVGLTVTRSQTNGNSINGIGAQNGSIAMTVLGSDASANQQSGISTFGGSGVSIRLGNTAVTTNNFGVSPSAPSRILSYGNNTIADNINDGAPSGSASLR